ncbi:MAG: amidohydrolase family protein [Acidobacteriota bacterium]|nr:amidohydrolase family protein [Acidobacteriota bacterium]
MRRATILPALLLFASLARSGDDVVAIQTGTLIDGTGGRAVKSAVILVEGERITAVGTDLTIPGGARVIDLTGLTVLPGFIDAHVHLVGRYIGEGRDWENSLVRDFPQEDAIRGVRNARLTLEAGFTTVRNVGAGDYTDIALRNMIDEGVVDGPRIIAAAHALGITGGHCDDNGFLPGVADRGPEDGIADGTAEIAKAIRTQVKRGADVIKFCATGGVLSEGDAVGVQQYTQEEMDFLVEEAHLTERKVAAHAHGNAGIKAALRAGVDSIEHGSQLDDEAIALFQETGAYLVPTLMAQEAVEAQATDGTIVGLRAEKALFIAPKARASFQLAAKEGIHIALGSDAGVFPHGTQGREFVLMVENGMDPMDAILAGTYGAADLLGVLDEVGTVQVGKIADLVAVDGNPLDDMSVVTRPVFVMHKGRVIVGH